MLAVDDHAIFLDVAREVVTSTPGFCWVGGAGSGEEGLRAVEALSPDLVLLDMRMPGMDGLEAAHRITAGHPGVVVVLVSIDEGSAIGPAIESSGAAALVRKQELGPKLLAPPVAAPRKGVVSAPAPGIVPTTDVPRPAAELSSRLPPTAASRSRMFTSPLPTWPFWVSKPGPSSLTSKRRSPLRRTEMSTDVASGACLATFWSASTQQKYAAVSTSGG